VTLATVAGALGDFDTVFDGDRRHWCRNSARELGWIEIRDGASRAAPTPNVLPEPLPSDAIGRDDPDAGDRDGVTVPIVWKHGSYNRARVLQLAFAWLATAVFAVSLGYFLYAYFFTFGVAEPGSVATRARALIADFALFTGFATHHSVFARTRFKHMVAALVSPPLERAVYTLMASVLFLLVCLLWQPVPGRVYALSGPWRVLGYGAQLVGLVLIVIASRALDVLDLSGVRQVERAESVAAPRPLETRGVYGIVRHPLYLGWALFVFGAPDMTLTRFSFAIISTSYLALAIPFEERGLIATFADDYQTYKRRVRWRMLPGLY
jgi:protein-S-isoprenylcysteine O-methyltransferase Ste14